jgi:hypothetical protein
MTGSEPPGAQTPRTVQAFLEVLESLYRVRVPA